MGIVLRYALVVVVPLSHFQLDPRGAQLRLLRDTNLEVVCIFSRTQESAEATVGKVLTSYWGCIRCAVADPFYRLYRSIACTILLQSVGGELNIDALRQVAQVSNRLVVLAHLYL